MSKKKTNNDNINYINIKGAKTHNLKDINLSIPKKKLIVITGVSGSGKSSLAFDTIFAEGQRRYIESLSAYARQFLGKLQKPNVDLIEGISPAIAIEQKVISRNPRSTVGTSTEIYDYLKLLFARIGKTISPISKQEVKRDQIQDVVDFICEQEKENKILILSPNKSGSSNKEAINILISKGFSRVKIQNNIFRLEDIKTEELDFNLDDIWLVVDRVTAENSEENLARIADSVQIAFYEGNGHCKIDVVGKKAVSFSNKFEKDGIEFELPSEHLFSFNNPYGACKKCEGFGSILGINEDKVIPNQSLSLYEDAVQCWKGEKLSKWKDRFIANSQDYNFPIHRPYNELNKDEIKLLWNGGKKIKGIRQFFSLLEKDNYKVQNRVMLARYRGKSTCPDCNGSRIREDANYVYVNKYNISELVKMPIKDLYSAFKSFKFSKNEKAIANRILIEINDRLKFLTQVGLGYLTLNRLSSTLSGGESQRINLSTSLGSSLVGSLYILDEPSIGLHPKDTEKLIQVLESLRDLGNSVIVVEHDEEIMQAADQLIDIGPFAGNLGGEVVFQGKLNQIHDSNNSITAQYLSLKKQIDLPKLRRPWNKSINIKGARENNLKNIDVEFPLNALTVITGVSGSGKSSLVKQILFPAVQKSIQGYTSKIGQFDTIDGNINLIDNIEFVDQNPIGRSSRSNPVTYIKAYDDIRTLFAKQELSKFRGYKSGHFSFNVPGGRCETCEGEGQITIEMQFMANVHLQCEDCKGQRFKEDTLEIKFGGKNISEILKMTVDQAIDFFKKWNSKSIVRKLTPLRQVGLGYIQLGQSSNTLSGGEAQRIKLAFFLSKGANTEKTFFIFDEPTTGLHFHDIKKLLTSFDALLDNGHTICCVEHNLDVIKCADWLIDLGPLGGENGGNIIFKGTPEDIISCKESYTGQHLGSKLSVSAVQK